MWQVLVPLLVVCLSDAAVAQAEPDGASATPPLTHSGSVNEAWLCAAPQRSTSPFFSHFTLESFGVNSSNVAPGYMLSSAYLASFYDLQGLECPDCILGPRNLSRPTLPPFGATVTVKLIGDHLELFAGFGGIEAWKAEGVFEPQGHKPFTSTDGDAWLTQGWAGFRFAVDHNRHLWLGGTDRRLYNFGPGPKQWTTLSGDATVRFGH